MINKFWHHFDRGFTPRAMKLLFWLVCIYAFSIGCVKNIKVKDLELGDRPAWCFRADFMADDFKTYSWNCFETAPVCRNALNISRKYGSLAKVISLSTCKLTLLEEE